MNKKKGAIITLILAIAIFGFRFYRKYERQQIREENRKRQLEFYQKGQKIRDSINRAKQDSVRRSKPTRLDSMMEVNKKKAEEMKKILEILEKEK